MAQNANGKPVEYKLFKAYKTKIMMFCYCP